jgi:hypothetical protein
MSSIEITRYANLAQVSWPTMDGDDLVAIYKVIAEEEQQVRFANTLLAIDLWQTMYNAMPGA